MDSGRGLPELPQPGQETPQEVRPLVTIGLPVYNGERYLARAIESVLTQTYTNIELIIADNHSTDRTPQIIESYAATDSRIKYYHHLENEGAAANFNFVLQQASGTYFKWLCADDYGLSPSVNAGIRELIARGRLNATSVMVAAPHLGDDEAPALELLNAGEKRAAIGLHVTLTAPFKPMGAEFAPVRDGCFLPLAEMLRAAITRRFDSCGASPLINR
jgi:glycosyltransferase involved in cell wall biosynthesis